MMVNSWPVCFTLGLGDSLLGGGAKPCLASPLNALLFYVRYTKPQALKRLQHICISKTLRYLFILHHLSLFLMNWWNIEVYCLLRHRNRICSEKNTMAFGNEQISFNEWSESTWLRTQAYMYYGWLRNLIGVKPWSNFNIRRPRSGTWQGCRIGFLKLVF